MAYVRFRELLHAGMIDALGRCEEFLQSIVGDWDDGYYPINAIAFDILPWFGEAGFGVRLQEDSRDFELADWSRFDEMYDICKCESELLGDAAVYARETWENPPPGTDGGQIKQLMFLAAADCLLSPEVETAFHAALRIDDAEQFEGWFEYIVVDADKSIDCNYCDVVRVQRIADETLPLWK